VVNGVVHVSSSDGLHAFGLDPEGMFGSIIPCPDPARLVPGVGPEATDLVDTCQMGGATASRRNLPQP